MPVENEGYCDWTRRCIGTAGLAWAMDPRVTRVEAFTVMAEDSPGDSEEEASKAEARIEPFLDMRDPTFRRILRAATSKFNQMICPLMATVCVRDLCMFWNDHSKSCLIVDGLKVHLYHTVCPKCQSTNVAVSAKEHRTGKLRAYRCDTCGNEWGQVH